MDPRWAQVDEAQLMSTEELPPENEALEPSGSESADLAGKVRPSLWTLKYMPWIVAGPLALLRGLFARLVPTKSRPSDGIMHRLCISCPPL